jgi:proteasome accessory factor B
MADSKTERLLQVVLCLSQSRRFVTKDQLRGAIPDYSGTPTVEAFERMFERDKNELRELGIPLETAAASGVDDDPGYRIDRNSYGLPPLHLTREEMTAVALAARVWQEQGPASAAARALLKISADGTDVDPAELPAIEPRLSGGEAAFEPLTAAVTRRRAVRFGYRTVRDTVDVERHLQPWGVVSRRGRWYVVGHDTDRGAVRVFRLSRITGLVTPDGPVSAFEVPPGADLRAQVNSFASSGPPSTARLLVRAGAGHGLRRRAAQIEAVDEATDRLTVDFTDQWALAEEITSYGAAVLVESPPDLRQVVVERLDAVVRRHSPRESGAREGSGPAGDGRVGSASAAERPA